MKKILYLFLILILFSCKGKKNKDILDQKTYKSVLKEILLTNIVKQDHKKIDSLNYNLIGLVYKKYKIDSLKLENTTEYYSRHPKKLTKIYQEIYQEIKKTSDSIEQLTPHQIPKTDAIKIDKSRLNQRKIKKKMP